ncbi:MAG: excinuclease ABC subunit UvrA [bacterium]
MKEKIIIKGAREHNLKNIDVEIPRDKLTVITGLSGSGKSSLAFDTLYAEGQRRYVESLSSYARQFLGQMEKPEVDYIEGLSPAISIEQKPVSKNPRSTVGTITEIYDYLRLLFARIGKPYCYKCKKPIRKQSPSEVVSQLEGLPENTKLTILSPLVSSKKGEHKEILRHALEEGFVRARIDGKMHELSERIKLDKNKKHSIEVVIDRIVIKEGIRKRLADSIETGMALSKGRLIVIAGKEELVFSSELSCPDCGVSYAEISPRIFSFNSPYGACSVCEGLGFRMEIDPELVVDKNKSIWRGAIKPSLSLRYRPEDKIEELAQQYGFRPNLPFYQLPLEVQNFFLYGKGYYEGIIQNLERRYRETKSEYIRGEIEKYMSYIPCSSCKGTRLKEESLSILIDHKPISVITAMSIGECLSFFSALKLKEYEGIIALEIIKEIKARLVFLVDVGLSYLTLDRPASTLSGGEGERIRLATQIGSGLVGVLYILDEPSIGLHQRDNKKLLLTLKNLRDLGNTIVVVEHDEETIRSADFVIDLGKGAGEEGGSIVAMGSPKEIIKNKHSLTGGYLSGRLKINLPKKRKKPLRFLKLKKASHNNLKNIDVSIPLGVFTCITGVSGSGKSSLIAETLHPALSGILHRSSIKPGRYEGLEGIEFIDKVINIDQSPIGRTPRSNPATYTGLFTPIRELFSELSESKARGYKPGRFSFNLKGGRCEACEGDGVKKIEMFFLADLYIPCEICKGKRYNRETLEIRYKGKNIADVLDMTVDAALEFFKNIPQIKHKLEVLSDVGLGYIKLGQPATTLSGGEAQRVKLSEELSKRQTGNTLYLLDEPTTGLHFEDIKRLLDVLFRLRDMGNTIVVIEHNMEVIKTADYIIDLGPEGGDEGGYVVAAGMPEEIVSNDGSYTGRFLKRYLMQTR